MNNFLKSWWYISIVFFFSLMGWLIYYGIDKAQFYKFSNFFLFFHLLLVFSLLINFLKVKKKIVLIFLIFYLLGNLIYFANIFNLNVTIKSVIRNNQFSLDLLGKIRNLTRGKTYDNKLFLENIEINDNFNGQILIKAEKFPNIFILKKNDDKVQIFNVFDFETVKNTNRLPLQLKKNGENWELVYFDYNNIAKILLDENFKFTREIWRLSHKLSFHHWGDSFEGKLFIPGSTSKTYPVKEKFDLGFDKKCGKGIFYFETIEIIDEMNGNHLKTVSILDKIVNIKKEFSENSDIINCKDPLHLNDVRIIKDNSIASYFPNGKVGDILLSLLTIEALILLDKDDYHMKWYSLGNTNDQHSPRPVSNGKMLVFNNEAGSRVYGRSHITSIDIVNNKITGTYKGENKKNYFQSNNAGRIQILDNSIFVNESQGSRLFKLKCENLSILLNCKRENIFKINIDKVFTHTLDIINNQ